MEIQEINNLKSVMDYTKLKRKPIGKLGFDKYKPKVNTNKNATSWGELGKELTAYFKKNMYWASYKWEAWKLRQALKVCKEKGIDNYAYFIGVLKNIK